MAKGGTVGSLWINVKANTMGLSKGLGKARGMLGKFGKFASSPAGLATVAFAGLTAGVIALGRGLSESVKKWMEFSNAMSEVRSVLLDVTNNEFKKLTDQAKLLGATTANTATEIAGAMTNLARAGFDSSEIEKSVESVSNLANATGMEMAEASDLIAVGVRAFGLDASEASRVADVFAMTASKTNTTVAELGEGMKYVAPVAKQLGFSIEETSAMLGKLADAGIKSTMGGTALRKMFLMLGKDIEEHGTEAFFDFMSTQQGVIKNFETFGARAVTSAGVLQDVSDEVARLTGELYEATGTAKTMSEIQLDNLEGDITLLKSAVDGLAIAVGEDLDNAMRSTTQTATGFVSSLTAGINELSVEIEKTSVGTRMWHGVLLVVNTILVALYGIVILLINAIQAIGYAIGALVSGALMLLMGGITSVFVGFKELFGLFMDTSGWEGAENFLWDITTGLGEQAGSMFSAMTEEIEEGAHAVTVGLIDGVVAVKNDLFGGGKAIGDAIGEGAKEGIEENVKKTQEVLDEGVAKLLEQVQKLVPKLQEQIDTFGMGKAEALAYALAQKGVTSELAHQAVELEKQLEALKEKQKADQKLASEAERVIESLRTPQQIYDDEVANLQKMVDAKLLTLEQFKLAVERLKTDTAEDDIEVNIVTKGIIEGLETALGSVKVAGQVSKTEQLAEKSASIQEKMQTLTESISASTSVTANVLENSIDKLSSEGLEELAKEGNEINRNGFNSVVAELKNIANKEVPLT